MKNQEILVLFDLDGTLTEIHSPWKYLLEKTNNWEQGKKNLEDFLEGRFDYQTFCNKDVDLLKKLTVKEFRSLLDEIPYRPNISKLIEYLKSKNSKIFIISAGFHYLAKKIAVKWDMDGFYANKLCITNGKLNGDVEIQVEWNNKDDIVRNLKRKLNFKGTTISFGDSGGDIGLFNESNISFACFNATEPTIKAATHHISDFKESIEILHKKFL